MLPKLRSRLTYANVVSTLCLFIVLGGTSYAVATGSIDSAEIKNNTVRSKDIRNNSILGKDVGNGRLDGADLRDDGVTERDVLESSLGRVPSADNANTANNANALGGSGPSAFVRVRSRVFQASASLVTDYGHQAPLASLTNLPAGQYIVNAKLWVDNDTPASEDEIDCTLDVSSLPSVEDDIARGHHGKKGFVADELPYALEATFTSSGTDSVSVSCDQPAGEDDDAHDVRIIAVLLN